MDGGKLMGLIRCGQSADLSIQPRKAALQANLYKF